MIISRRFSLVLPYFKVQDKLFFYLQKRVTKDDLYGLYELPGGKCEEQESPPNCAVREFKEEVGDLLDPSRLKLAQIHQHSTKSENTFYIFAYYLDKRHQRLVEFEFKGYLSDEFKKDIPPENILFLEEILKTL